MKIEVSGETIFWVAVLGIVVFFLVRRRRRRHAQAASAEGGAVNPGTNMDATGKAPRLAVIPEQV